MRTWRRWLAAAGSLAGSFALCLGLAGCNLDDENDYDVVPSAGKGTLVVDNETTGDINLYVGGQSRGQVDDDSYLPSELNPGVYRVVLDGDDDDRVWAADVDILEGRLTVLRVSEDSDDRYDYDVTIDFD
jgi:hypothetical protein